MKLGHVAAELGFDMRLDVVLARIEQLVHLESSAVIENKTVAHNLQRKVGNIVPCSTKKRNYWKSQAFKWSSPTMISSMFKKHFIKLCI